MLLIVFTLLGDLFTFTPGWRLSVASVCYSDCTVWGVGLQDMHSRTVIKTLSFMQPLSPDVCVCVCAFGTNQQSHFNTDSKRLKITGSHRHRGLTCWSLQKTHFVHRQVAVSRQTER